MNGNLLHIRLPVDALLCQDVLCCNTDHITALDCYSQAITEACLNAANCAIPHTHNKVANRLYLDGLSSLNQLERNRFSGTKFGLIVVDLRPALWPA